MIRGTTCLTGIPRSLRLLLIILLLLTGLSARAETFKTADPGPGYVPITAAWQFHTGDDLAWASPAFNDTGHDSGWQAIQPDEPWGAQGHLGYTGYAWYRKRIEIGQTDLPLGLYIPAADGAYEVFWDGKKIGSSGSLPPHAVWWIIGKDAVFSLGEDAAAG